MIVETLHQVTDSVGYRSLGAVDRDDGRILVSAFQKGLGTDHNFFIVDIDSSASVGAAELRHIGFNHLNIAQLFNEDHEDSEAVPVCHRVLTTNQHLSYTGQSAQRVFNFSGRSIERQVRSGLVIEGQREVTNQATRGRGYSDGLLFITRHGLYQRANRDGTAIAQERRQRSGGNNAISIRTDQSSVHIRQAHQWDIEESVAAPPVGVEESDCPGITVVGLVLGSGDLHVASSGHGAKSRIDSLSSSVHSNRCRGEPTEGHIEVSRK